MRRLLLTFALLWLSMMTSNAQRSRPDTVSASFITSKINFDGKLSEPEWELAQRIGNFTQRELDFGKPSSERTEVAVVYTRVAIYFGIWCYMEDPEKIVAKFLQRDFDFDSDDNFRLIISPFNDRRNGYEFIINPLGARADLLVSGPESSNSDWNGVWDARTSINDKGWFAEIIIPFTSLKFRRAEEHVWAVNFERNIRSRNEHSRWQGWSRDFTFESIVNAGVLTGIRNIGYSKLFELKPYSLAGYSADRNDPTQYTGKIGADLNVNITPTLKLNLTANTDFAQVEADRIPVNLTRFSLFYPEKREFFLEGYQNYEFNFGNNNRAFYTRTVGLENRRPVPVIAGVRVFGKEKRSNIGFLSIQTGRKDTLPSANNTVFRYRHDLGKQSNAGIIFTSKLSEKSANQVFGADASFGTNQFLTNKNLTVYGNFARSHTSMYNDQPAAAGNGYSYRLFVDYPNDLMDIFASVSETTEDFHPELGFLNRTNFRLFSWNFRFTPRWFTRYGVRKMFFRPWGFDLYQTRTTGELESFNNESRPLGFFLKSGEYFEYNLIQQYDRPDENFDLTDEISIPSGKYWMFRQEVQFGTFQGRRLWANMAYQWGDFYTGAINALEAESGINISKHLNLSTEYTFRMIRLPDDHLNTHELVQFINFAFNTKLNVTCFIQWNSVADYLAGNFRLHWIPKIGMDFFVVFNQDYRSLRPLELRYPETNTAVAKIVWRFVF